MDQRKLNRLFPVVLASASISTVNFADCTDCIGSCAYPAPVLVGSAVGKWRLQGKTISVASGAHPVRSIFRLTVTLLIGLGGANSALGQAYSRIPDVNSAQVSDNSETSDAMKASAGNEWSLPDLVQRIQHLEQNQTQLEEHLRERDEWIEGVLSVPNTVAPPHWNTVDVLSEDYFGTFTHGGPGFKLANTRCGDVNFSAWSYVRYLNQNGLDENYTDAFGRDFKLEKRNDVQLNKVNLYFKGWAYDPKFRYLLYVWTANTAQGDPAQVVVGGNLNYVFNESLTLGGGIDALPGVRTTRGTFPYWLRVDYRTIADEFFRPSFTQGIWARGKIAERMQYRLMLGNNLSQLGVNAAKLDDTFDTVSGAIWWMPTTGEFGPLGGYGDFESHETLATLVGVSMTHSTEDKQSQPGTEDLNNTQLRLSDGTIIFTRDAFDTGGQINRATYYMMSIDAGLKYRGLAIEGEYYFRWLQKFRTAGVVPVNSLFDHGFQVQLSAMVVPETLQAYVAGSYIAGQYGTPSDVAVGVNWFPRQERLFRVNCELLHLDESPVGYASVPFAVGGKGLVFNANVELNF